MSTSAAFLRGFGVVLAGLAFACVTESSERPPAQPAARERERDAGGGADADADQAIPRPELGEAFCPPELTFHEAQTIRIEAQDGHLFAANLEGGSAEAVLFVSSSKLFVWRTGQNSVDAYPLPLRGDTSLYPPLVADFNGDRHPDVLVNADSNQERRAFAVFTNDGRGALGTPRVTELLEGEWVGAAGDVMGGPEVDVVAGSFGGATRVLVGLADGGFAFGAELLRAGAPRALAIAQLDSGHPKQDIVLDNRVLLSRPGDRFEEVLLQEADGFDLILPGDVDGDEILDLVLWSRLGIGFHVRGAGQGRFEAAQPLEKLGSSPEYSSSEWLRDVDGDGRADFLFAKDDVRFTRMVDGMLRYQGRLGSASEQRCEALALLGAGRFVPADVNGDGKVDLVTADRRTLGGDLQLSTYLSSPKGR